MYKNNKIQDKLLLEINNIKQDYLINNLSKENLAKKYNVCLAAMNRFLSDNNIYRDKGKVQSINQLAKGKQRLDDLANSIGVDNIKKFYIEDNHTIDELMNEFNLTNWTASKLLKYLNIKKPQSIATKVGVQHKYDKYGSKEAYDKHVEETKKETIINKDGSLKEHYAKVAEKCRNAWKKKTINNK